MSECEYDPINQTAKYEGKPCRHNATLSMNAYSQDFLDSMGTRRKSGESRGNWHICDCCAASPQFKRRKKDPFRDIESNCEAINHCLFKFEQIDVELGREKHTRAVCVDCKRVIDCGTIYFREFPMVCKAPVKGLCSCVCLQLRCVCAEWQLR